MKQTYQLKLYWEMVYQTQNIGKMDLVPPKKSENKRILDAPNESWKQKGEILAS